MGVKEDFESAGYQADEVHEGVLFVRRPGIATYVELKDVDHVAALLAPEHIKVTNAQLREGNRGLADSANAGKAK